MGGEVTVAAVAAVAAAAAVADDAADAAAVCESDCVRVCNDDAG